jgi:hypothetical protein
MVISSRTTRHPGAAGMEPAVNFADVDRTDPLTDLSDDDGCPAQVEGAHCDCWYDGAPCCACKAPAQDCALRNDEPLTDEQARRETCDCDGCLFGGPCALALATTHSNQRRVA